jgi:hypothetical protein
MNKVFIELMDRFLLSVIGGVKPPMALVALFRIGLVKNNWVAGVPGCKLPVTGCQKLMAIGIGVKMVLKKGSAWSIFILDVRVQRCAASGSAGGEWLSRM